jgi:hypothetical protein
MTYPSGDGSNWCATSEKLCSERTRVARLIEGVKAAAQRLARPAYQRRRVVRVESIVE